MSVQTPEALLGRNRKSISITSLIDVLGGLSPPEFVHDDYPTSFVKISIGVKYDVEVSESLRIRYSRILHHVTLPRAKRVVHHGNWLTTEYLV